MKRNNIFYIAIPIIIIFVIILVTMKKEKKQQIPVPRISTSEQVSKLPNSSDEKINRLLNEHKWKQLVGLLEIRAFLHENYGDQVTLFLKNNPSVEKKYLKNSHFLYLKYIAFEDIKCLTKSIKIDLSNNPAATTLAVLCKDGSIDKETIDDMKIMQILEDAILHQKSPISKLFLTCYVAYAYEKLGNIKEKADKFRYIVKYMSNMKDIVLAKDDKATRSLADKLYKEGDYAEASDQYSWVFNKHFGYVKYPGKHE